MASLVSGIVLLYPFFVIGMNNVLFLKIYIRPCQTQEFRLASWPFPKRAGLEALGFGYVSPWPLCKGLSIQKAEDVLSWRPVPESFLSFANGFSRNGIYPFL